MIDILSNTKPMLKPLGDWLYINYTVVLLLGLLIIGFLSIGLTLLKNQKWSSTFRKLLVYSTTALFTISMFVLMIFLINIYMEPNASKDESTKSSSHVFPML